MVRAGLKAGIIMGIVAAVFGVASFLPAELMRWAQCCSLLVIPVLWFVSGILAARFAPAGLTTGAAVGGGAVAGAITQVIGGIVDTLVALVPGIVRPAAAAFALETTLHLAQLGLSPQDVETLVQSTSGPLGAVITCLGCVGVGAAIAAGLGAVGGILGRAVSRRRRA